MKPGPAISTLWTACEAGSAATMASANSRGLRRALFASPMATLLAKSPCWRSRARSTLASTARSVGKAPMACSCARAWASRDSRRCFIRLPDYDVRLRMGHDWRVLSGLRPRLAKGGCTTWRKCGVPGEDRRTRRCCLVRGFGDWAPPAQPGALHRQNYLAKQTVPDSVISTAPAQLMLPCAYILPPPALEKAPRPKNGSDISLNEP